MFRFIILVIAIILMCLSSLFFWLYMWIVHFFKPELVDRTAFFFVTRICKIGTFLSGAKLDIQGLENLPTDHPVLFILNHRSIFDVVFSYALMKYPTGFVAKKEIETWPFFSQWLRLNHGIFMDRKNIREGMKAILKGIEELKNGYSIVIFPEGTRNRDKDDPTTLLPFHAGSFKLAEKSGVPIVPMVLYNAAGVFENHFPIVKGETVKIRILEPINLTDLPAEDRRKICDIVRDKMQETLIELHQ